MRAADLMPPDGRRSGPKITLRSAAGGDRRQREPKQPRPPRPPRQPRQRPAGGGPVGPLLVVLAVLLGVLAVTAGAILEHNTVNDRKATLAALGARIATAQEQAARLNANGDVITAEREVAGFIQSVAGTRFNWYSALTGFGEVITPNTYFTSLTYSAGRPGTSSSGTTASGATASGTTTSTGPSFAVDGCTGSQNEVASTMRQLRRIRGVISVSETTGATGVQLSNSNRLSTTRRDRSGLPTKCSDTFSLAVLFAPPTTEDNGR